jgi:hypothetical protein
VKPFAAVVGEVSKPAACASDLFDEWVESFGLALAMPLSMNASISGHQVSTVVSGV